MRSVAVAAAPGQGAVVRRLRSSALVRRSAGAGLMSQGLAPLRGEVLSG